MHKDRRGYLYRTFREEGRVRREYIGQGEWPQLRSELEQGRAWEKQQQKRRTQQAMAHEVAFEAQVREFGQSIEMWRRLVLVQNGFRQHKRGEWRRQRGANMNAIEKANGAGEQELGELLALASKDRGAAQQFLALTEEAGLLDAYLATVADLGTRAQAEIIKKAVPDGDPLTLAAFTKKIERMHTELSGPAPTELEKQLAQRIVLEWLLLTYFEANLTLNLDSEKWVPFYEKRVESTQRRYLSSLKTLAHIRKLQLPALQINLARNQINTQINE